MADDAIVPARNRNTNSIYRLICSAILMYNGNLDMSMSIKTCVRYKL